MNLEVAGGDLKGGRFNTVVPVVYFPMISIFMRFVSKLNIAYWCTVKKCEEFMLELYKIHGSLKQKLTSLQAQKKELEDLREEYSAYDLFMQCMHSINYEIYSIIC